MADTVRTNSAVLGLFTLAGAAKRLVPQFVRDFIVSVHSWLAPAYVTLTNSAGTVTWATGGEKVNNAKITLAANVSTLTITGAVEGATGWLEITQNGTGGFTFAIPSSTVVGATLAINLAANKKTALFWSYNGATFWIIIAQEA